MARSSTPFKRGKPVYTLLAVTCGRKAASTDGGAVTAASVAAAAAAAPAAGNGTAEGSTKVEVLENPKSEVEDVAFRLRKKEELLQRKTSPGLPGYSDLVSKGQLEVHLLECPSKEEVKSKIDSLHPDYLSLHGEQVPGRDDIGGLIWGDEKACTPDELATLFAPKLPDLVYLEIASGDKSGQALRALGIKHVIYWKLSSCSRSVAFHFRQGLLASLQSSGAGGWDAYRFSKACSQVYFCRSKLEGQPVAKNSWPHLLGDAPPKIEVTPPDDGETSKASEAALAAIQIFDDDIEIRLLVCTEISKIDAAWLDAMEAGLTAMLTIEARSLRMLNKMSAPPPPMAAAVFARGVVTMRCDICTTSLARVAILVSGSAQLCFDDQQLENSIKKELLERVRLVRIVKPAGDRKAAFQVSEMRRSICMASGARVVEIRFTTPAWAGQVLRQLGTDPTYRSLAALGIVGLQGGIVAAFTKDDAVPIASSKFEPQKVYRGSFPAWLIPPPPTRDRANLFNLYSSSEESMDREEKPLKANKGKDRNSFVQSQPSTGVNSNTDQGKRLELTSKQRAVFEAMKPFPNRVGPMPSRYAALIAAARASGQIKVNFPNGTSKGGRPHLTSVSAPASSHAPSTLSSYSQSIAPGSLLLAGNAPLVKPHGCSRRPIDDCAEEDFVSDLIKFLVSRGHGRLIPPVGAEGFPEVVLNGKRLDLYNLYREVVSRGGFHVGNGINWKGQVFSKMRNHTLTNKMTGVGNTLKKHYETYLLEYELAHNDVDGECCILCHSGAAGDWVNCGSCGEWAHFGCDKRTGLGTFKDYSKTDGLEYICPNCNTANGRSAKRQKVRRAGGVAQAEVVVTKGVPRKTTR